MTLADLYHINPTTGRPNKCTAQTRECPFGGAEAHATTREEARELYERAMEQELLPQAVSKLPKLPRDVAAVYSPIVGDVYPLTPRETALLKRRLRGGLTAKELKALEIDATVPAHVHYNRNGEAAFDYDDHDTQNVFSKGACGYLAYALHEKTGLPMTMFTDDPTADYWQGHMALRVGKDSYLDVRGLHSEDEIAREYGLKKGVYSTREVEDEATFRGHMRLDGECGVYGRLDELEVAILDRVSRDIVRDYL